MAVAQIVNGPPPPDPDLEWLCNEALAGFQSGNVVLFLGAGVNLCGRDNEFTIEKNLPNGNELAKYLIEFTQKSAKPKDATLLTGCEDLLVASQFLRVCLGDPKLYEALRRVFVHEYHPTPVHSVIAQIAKHSKLEGQPFKPVVIVTTNYDTVLENALIQARADFEVVWYAARLEPPRFRHQSVIDGKYSEIQTIDNYNKYTKLPLNGEYPTRPIVLKIHGAVHPKESEEDSFVISQNDYIAFLADIRATYPLPPTLASVIRTKPFLFLGYSLSDWNMQVLLRLLSSDTRWKVQSNAVLQAPSKVQQRIWEKMDVALYDFKLEDFSDCLLSKVNRVL